MKNTIPKITTIKEYEEKKKEISDIGLTYREYEKEIQKIAKELNI